MQLLRQIAFSWLQLVDNSLTELAQVIVKRLLVNNWMSMLSLIDNLSLI